MKNALFYVLAFVISMVFVAPSRGEITTVILSEHGGPEFAISEESMPTLRFNMATALPADAEVKRCELRVVAKKWTTKSLGGQSVRVQVAGEQIGQWSAHDSEYKPYHAPLKPKKCESKETVDLTLQADESLSPSEWRYHGGKAEKSSEQPRLIVTYASAFRETSAVSGERTSWTYESPVGFFASPLPLSPGHILLTNPVTYGGAVFVVVGSSEAQSLQRTLVTGAFASWQLPDPVDKGSFAFATAWGHMYIITTDRILRYDLARLGDSYTKAASLPEVQIKVNPDETPAMGPDGSIYFKNIEANGQIIGYNPGFRELWQTDLKIEHLSPITLSPDGRFAFALANYDDGEGKKSHLLRIDTATGAKQPHLISYDTVQPLLSILHRPAVIREEKSDYVFDYVFVAGNTSDSGILQLIRFTQKKINPDHPQIEVVRTQHGKVATAPVASRDGDSVFVVQGGKLKRYRLDGTEYGTEFSGNGDRNTDHGCTAAWPDASGNLAIDGDDSVYLSFGRSLYAYNNTLKQVRGPTCLDSELQGMLFTADGALVGYSDQHIYNISPKAEAGLFPLTRLTSETIYSGDAVTLLPTVSIDDEEGLKVILQGRTIKLPNGFRWPRGKILKLKNVP